MTTMSKEEILQALLDKKQLQEWDGIAEKFFNIIDQQALSNIVHGKVCIIRTSPCSAICITTSLSCTE